MLKTSPPVATWPRLVVPVTALLVIGIAGPILLSVICSLLAAGVASWWTLHAVAEARH